MISTTAWQPGCQNDARLAWRLGSAGSTSYSFSNESGMSVSAKGLERFWRTLGSCRLTSDSRRVVLLLSLDDANCLEMSKVQHAGVESTLTTLSAPRHDTTTLTSRPLRIQCSSSSPSSIPPQGKAVGNEPPSKPHRRWFLTSQSGVAQQVCQ